MARGDGDWLDKTTLLVAALRPRRKLRCHLRLAIRIDRARHRGATVARLFGPLGFSRGVRRMRRYPRARISSRVHAWTDSQQWRDACLPGARSDKLDRLQRHKESDRLMPADFDFRDHQPTGLVSATDIGRDQHKDVSGEIGADEVPTFRMAAQGGSTLYTGTSIIAMSSESRTAPPTASSTSPGPVSRSPSATDTTARFRHTHTCAH